MLQLCPSPLPSLESPSPVGFDMHVEMHVVLTGDGRRELNTHIHTSHIQAQIGHLSKCLEYMQSSRAQNENMGLNWHLEWANFQIYVPVYFQPRFGLEWYSVVQCCITALSRGKGAASSLNKNNVKNEMLWFF